MNEKDSDMKQRLKAIGDSLKKHRMSVIAFLGVFLVGAVVLTIFLTRPSNDESKSASKSDDERLVDVLGKTPEPTAVSTFKDAEATLPPTRPAIPDFTKAPNATDAPGTRDLLSPPVGGKVIWGFAADELIYSETLNQWMTHMGVDIACDKESTIRCVSEGKIERIYTDDQLGEVVIIEHKNGDRSVYAGVTPKEGLKEGSSVSANEDIGTSSGDISSECGIDPHIHFEYHVDGRPADPALYVLFTS